MSSTKEFHIFDFPDKVYVKIEDKFRKKLFNQVYKRFGSKRKAAKEFNISLKSLLRYEKGYGIFRNTKYNSFIPIKILKKFTDFQKQEELEMNIDVIKLCHGLKVYNFKFPIRESPELYSIIGHMIADGSQSTHHVPYYANSNKILRKSFIEKLSIFGNFKVKEKKTRTTVIVEFPKVITDVIQHLFDFQITHPNRIPKLLFSSSKECKCSFLRALFDDDGTITTTLSLCIHNERLLNQVKQLLDDFNIKTGKITKTSYHTKKEMKYRMSFNILKKSYENFQKKINFSHPDKVKKLGFAIRTSKRQQRTRNPDFIDEKIIEMLEIRQSTTMEIANCLLFTISGILHHLNRLEKENIIVKKGYKNKMIWDLV